LNIALQPCLYCETTTRRMTDEHVLQKALGAELILRNEVCSHCNTGIFSPIDTEFVAYVRTLRFAGRVGVEHNRGLLQSGHSVSRDPNTGIWFSVRRKRRGGIVPFRQIALSGERHAVAIPDSGVVKTLHEDLATPSGLRTSSVVLTNVPGAEPSLIWSAPRTYAVRASTHGEAESVLSRVRDGTLLVGRTIEVVPDSFAGRAVSVSHRSSHSPRAISRALAKIAMNFLCYTTGGPVARNPAFRPIKEAILRDSEDVFAFVEADAFSKHSAEVQSVVKSFCRPNHHTLLLGDAGDGPHAMVALYGEPYANIRLVRGLAGPPLFTSMFLALFDHQARTHRILSSHDGTFPELASIE